MRRCCLAFRIFSKINLPPNKRIATATMNSSTGETDNSKNPVIVIAKKRRYLENINLLPRLLPSAEGVRPIESADFTQIQQKSHHPLHLNQKLNRSGLFNSSVIDKTQQLRV